MSRTPKLVLTGAPFERGRQHGEQARETVRGGVDFYTRLWDQNTGRSREELLELAAEFGPRIAAFDARIYEEIEGVAAGADVTVAEVLEIDARYELMLVTVFGDGDGKAPAECTSLAAGPGSTESGHTLIGQNWDWAAEVGERSVLLEIRQEDGPDILTHVEAGFMGHKGLNSAGLGICANAMSSNLDRFAPAVPMWVVARGLLNSATIDEAVQVAERAERAVSINFMIASRQGEVAALELTPVDVQAVGRDPGRLSHTNVFAGLTPERGVEDRLAGLYPLFRDRDRRAAELISDGPVSVADMQRMLSDHANRPESVCRHVEDQPVAKPSDIPLQTIASVVMDLDESRMYVADGPPCCTAYQEHALA